MSKELAQNLANLSRFLQPTQAVLSSTIDWNQHSLIPTIVQDYHTKEVLMLAFSNEESLNLSFQTLYAHYFSRSKQRIWKKGEQSGHTQEIIDIRLDCDNDSLLFIVKQEGVACHTGSSSCFFKNFLQPDSQRSNPKSIDTTAIYGVIDLLYHTILKKKSQSQETSYTASLFAKGENTICKKIIEEAGELTFALKDKNQDDIIYECADLVYHVLVGLGSMDISPDRIRQELYRRLGISGIVEKNSRQK